MQNPGCICFCKMLHLAILKKKRKKVVPFLIISNHHVKKKNISLFIDCILIFYNINALSSLSVIVPDPKIFLSDPDPDIRNIEFQIQIQIQIQEAN
jgi:hypothetical protein